MALQRGDFLRAAEALQQDPIELPGLMLGREERYLREAVPIMTARFLGGIMTRAEAFNTSASLLAETPANDRTARGIKRLALFRVSHEIQVAGFQTASISDTTLHLGRAYQQLVVFWGSGKAEWELGDRDIELTPYADKSEVLANSVIV